jgi:hypothetical protein
MNLATLESDSVGLAPVRVHPLLPAAATNRFASPPTRRIEMQTFVQPDIVSSLQEALNLQEEAKELESWYGQNAYSTYLRQHRRRPAKEEAAAIGRLLGGRVRADDGSMQPRPTAAERKALKARQEAFARRHEQVTSLKAAIAALAELPDNATDLISEFLSSDMVANTDAAVCWLQRFAGQCHGWKQIKNAANSNAYCRGDGQGHAQRRDP